MTFDDDLRVGTVAADQLRMTIPRPADTTAFREGWRA